MTLLMQAHDRTKDPTIHVASVRNHLLLHIGLVLISAVVMFLAAKRLGDIDWVYTVLAGGFASVSVGFIRAVAVRSFIVGASTLPDDAEVDDNIRLAARVAGREVVYLACFGGVVVVVAAAGSSAEAAGLAQIIAALGGGAGALGRVPALIQVVRWERHHRTVLVGTGVSGRSGSEPTRFFRDHQPTATA